MPIFYRRLPRFEYVRPGSLDEALSLVAEYGSAARLMAGGTDLLPQLKSRETPAPRYVIDLKGIPGLDGIARGEEGGLFIGPLTTMSDIEGSATVRNDFNPLVQAASTMASPQVRNRGTFAGNICSAVPSADSAPALLAMDAAANLRSVRGTRTVPMDAFFVGPRQTAIGQDEVLVGITVPAMAPGSRGVYLKHAPRRSMDLAIVGVAALVTCENGVCKDIRIALGAVGPTPFRAKRAEEVIRGGRVSGDVIEEAARVASTECRPINDHRASAEYRCDMVYVLTRRALTQVLAQ